MDELSVEEFLSQIGPEFNLYSTIFRKNGFDTIGSLRCIVVEQDIDMMFKEANVELLLGKKRQLQNALRNLQDVQPASSSSIIATASSLPVSNTKSSMENISDASKVSFEKMKRQLELSEAEYATFILVEKEKDLGRRCTNCHQTGHKADGNKNNQPCTKPPCVSISQCGQADKHPEYLIEKRKKQREIAQLNRNLRSIPRNRRRLIHSFLRERMTF